LIPFLKVIMALLNCLLIYVWVLEIIFFKELVQIIKFVNRIVGFFICLFLPCWGSDLCAGQALDHWAFPPVHRIANSITIFFCLCDLQCWPLISSIINFCLLYLFLAAWMVDYWFYWFFQRTGFLSCWFSLLICF
jgi:hypothetical protein